MRLGAKEFRQWDRKAITLLGMSGVGKTTLARTLRRHHWFHYSGDYRIGTAYLGEPIVDNIKMEAMKNPLLRGLLRSDSIHMGNNISVDNLTLLASFLGKVGNPERGGLNLREFRRRQKLHRCAEIRAMQDVPGFIEKVRNVYGYNHFVNDAGGSLCELEDDSVIELLARHTVILYIKATQTDEQQLLCRAEADPKPMYYPDDFLLQQLEDFMSVEGLEYVAQIDPDNFVRWVFPRLFRARIPRYDEIASEFGYTVTTAEIAGIDCEQRFVDLIANILDQQG